MSLASGLHLLQARASVDRTRAGRAGPSQEPSRVTPSPRLPIARLLDSAHALADASGRAILPYFRKPIAVEDKSRGGRAFDPVTAADKAAERAIRRSLAVRHPDHGILGEEFGTDESTSPFTWVIDPIDGTKAFLTGAPLWGTLIGLEHERRAVLGLMDQPFTGERIWSDAKGTSWRGRSGRAKRIRTRACPRLADAVLATTSPDLLASGREQDVFGALKSRVRFTRYGGDCYGYCLLAAGHIDIIVECGLKPYDIVALVPIIERAGGRVTTWDGGPAEQGGRIIAAGDPRLHEAALEMMARR
jgi:myo-inositol-1(or 4)-monophosphatase